MNIVLIVAVFSIGFIGGYLINYVQRITKKNAPSTVPHGYSRLSVNIPATFHKDLKAVADFQNTTMSSIVIRLLGVYITSFKENKNRYAQRTL
jgi:hypothetical protein